MPGKVFNIQKTEIEAPRAVASKTRIQLLNYIIVPEEGQKILSL